MLSRRRFIGSLCLPMGAAFTLPALSLRGGRRLRDVLSSVPRGDVLPAASARDESFWLEIQKAFDVDRGIVNLNNGGISPSPTIVHEALKRNLDGSNSAPAYTMWRVQEPQRETVRARLASAFGCDPGEMAIVRNASEGLQTCQFGFDLAPGDEVLTSNQDYPRMIATFKQRQRREGIVLRQFSLPVPCEEPRKIVSLFEANITPRTRLILVCHVINLTGQILPVREIVAMARKRGIPVIVDGAHGFGQLEFSRRDLDCDYYATSLHKWLFAPTGTGFLYVRKEKIRDLWPLMAAPEEMSADIRKFEEIGTHPAANVLAIGEALAFQDRIGPKRKEERLRTLRDTWAKRLTASGRVRLLTSLRPEFSCGIGLVAIEGIDSLALSDHLWSRHRILTAAIKHPEFEGIRVSASLYTTMEELDRFCAAMESVIRDGLDSSGAG